MEEQQQSTQMDMQQLYNGLLAEIKASQTSLAKLSDKMDANLADLKNGQQVSETKMAELKKGQDDIFVQLNANKQESDRKIRDLDSAYSRLRDDLQEVKSHVENLPAELSDKVIEAVYAKVQSNLDESTGRANEDIVKRFDQLKEDFQPK